MKKKIAKDKYLRGLGIKPTWTRAMFKDDNYIEYHQIYSDTQCILDVIEDRLIIKFKIKNIEELIWFSHTVDVRDFESRVDFSVEEWWENDFGNGIHYLEDLISWFKERGETFDEEELKQYDVSTLEGFRKFLWDFEFDTVSSDNIDLWWGPAEWYPSMYGEWSRCRSIVLEKMGGIEYPIHLLSDGSLLDGAHRIAVARFEKDWFIPAEIGFPRQWFEKEDVEEGSDLRRNPLDNDLRKLQRAWDISKEPIVAYNLATHFFRTEQNSIGEVLSKLGIGSIGTYWHHPLYRQMLPWIWDAFINRGPGATAEMLEKLQALAIESKMIISLKEEDFHIGIVGMNTPQGKWPVPFFRAIWGKIHALWLLQHEPRQHRNLDWGMSLLYEDEISHSNDPNISIVHIPVPTGYTNSPKIDISLKNINESFEMMKSRAKEYIAEEVARMKKHGFRKNPIQPEDIKTICCVCQTHLSGRMDAPYTSHGYCKPCAIEELRKFKKSLPKKPDQPNQSNPLMLHTPNTPSWDSSATANGVYVTDSFSRASDYAYVVGEDTNSLPIVVGIDATGLIKHVDPQVIDLLKEPYNIYRQELLSYVRSEYTDIILELKEQGVVGEARRLKTGTFKDFAFGIVTNPNHYFRGASPIYLKNNISEKVEAARAILSHSYAWMPLQIFHQIYKGNAPTEILKWLNWQVDSEESPYNSNSLYCGLESQIPDAVYNAASNMFYFDESIGLDRITRVWESTADEKRNLLMQRYTSSDEVFHGTSLSRLLLAFPEFKRELEQRNPIQHLQLLGNWNKNSGFKEIDRRLLTSEKGIIKIKKLWSRNQYPFNVYFVNKPNVNVANFREVGLITPYYLRETMKLSENEVLLEPNAITIIYTGNYGADKVHMSGWIMAHRFGHALSRRNGISAGTFKVNNLWLNFVEYVNHLLGKISFQIYGINLYDASNYKVAERKKRVFTMALGTMRSARSRSLRNAYEFNYELLAQYLTTGKIRLNKLTDKIQLLGNAWGKPQFRKTKDLAAVDMFNNDMPYYESEIESLLDTVLQAAVGQVFVM